MRLEVTRQLTTLSLEDGMRTFLTASVVGFSVLMGLTLYAGAGETKAKMEKGKGEMKADAEEMKGR